MQIKIKNQEDINKIRKGGKILANFLNNLKSFLREGISLLEIDREAELFILKHKAIPAFKNFRGFPSTICASVNEDIIHGIPSDYVLKNGDIVSIDIGIIYEGRFADTAYTYCIGEVDESTRLLVENTKKALYLGIQEVISGARIGDLSSSIEKVANALQYGIVRDYCGHGVGFELWEEPNIPNYGKKGFGPRLVENMVIAIEPMFTLGSDDILVKADKWTVTTRDASMSAHFEHTVWVKKDGFEILTEL